VGDFIPVTVELSPSGPAEGLRGARIDLVDETSGRVLDSRTLPDPVAPGSTPSVTLMTKPASQQEARWIVRTSLPNSVQPDEATAKATDTPVRLRVVDRPIRVAMFDGYPRWEYRYLKNLLLREKSIRSAALVLSADRRYLQEGTDPLASVPRTREEWQPFDVIVMGDVRSELFGAEQLAQIRELVSTKGAGLLWIAGPSSTPQSWVNTPLADLIPFTLDDHDTSPHVFAESVLVSPTPGAERLGVLRLGEGGSGAWPDILSDPSAGWTALRYAQLIEPQRLKPAAEVIATATPVSASIGTSASKPLVITMRYGAGRVIYVATDEIWRWRYGRGETLPERFWLPLVRWLARESLSRSGQSAVLEVSPDRASVDQPVQVSIRLIDQSLLSSRPESLNVKVRTSDPASPQEQTIALKPQDESRETGEAGSGLYSASWTFSEPGQYTVRPSDAVLGGLGLAAQVEIRDRDDEMRETATDHELLKSLSDATGGKVLRPADLGRLPDLLPNREVRTAGTGASESLWDKPVVWITLISLLCLEWIGRRLIRLA
jgi:hypothetical protein